ncbi:ABC transporter permease [Aestuariimicrobium kwangyangense]|uniref:ABC transporter permease n=1 Tax=Aestuariimicrobium kwangyangense TaxID=396389 RepID=UPI0003B46043|nr:ABC transporter permease subunit [Aestuariimicrobium kwangyangense]
MSVEARPVRPFAFWRLVGSEISLMLSRRRNQLGLVILAAVPVVMAVAIKTSGDTGLMVSVANGTVLPMLALMMESAFFLPLAMSLLAGDAIAGEAHGGTLRYLLVTPVGRARLLAVKFAGLLVGAFFGTFLIAVVGLVAGVMVFGSGASMTLSGTAITFTESLGRLALMALFLALMMTAVGTMGLFLSTLVDQPLAVTVGCMVVVILSWLTEATSQLAWLQPYLLTHWFLQFADVLRDPPLWSRAVKGLGVAAAWMAVTGAAAWARFTSKDIGS